MGGNPIWSDRETDDTLRERCPTNEEFLREMAGIEFGPPYKRRFAEAADELSRLRDIVATLPQCYRLVDGVPVQDCPVVPGMTVWFTEEHISAKIHSYLIGEIGPRGNARLWTVESDRCIGLQDTGNCANSRECAEAMAARKGTA